MKPRTTAQFRIIYARHSHIHSRYLKPVSDNLARGSVIRAIIRSHPFWVLLLGRVTGRPIPGPHVRHGQSQRAQRWVASLATFYPLVIMVLLTGSMYVHA